MHTKMPGPIRIRQCIVPILMIVLVLVTMMGMVCHHHTNNSADGCTLCHLAIAPAVPHEGVCGPAPFAVEFAVQSERIVSRCVVTQKPSRAPPV